MQRTKIKALAGVGGVAAALALSAGPAFATAITSPTSPYTVPVQANGNPNLSQITVSGSGWTPGTNVYLIICDGTPITAQGWSATTNCDNGAAGSATQANSSGVVTFPGTNASLHALVFRGVSPSDTFNCLAPLDDPNGTTTTSGSAIDPADPSWGASTVGSGGGGTAGCQILMTSTPAESSHASTDQAVSLILGPSVAPSTPESPLAVALPLGAVAIFGAGGVILYRKRRTASAA